MELQSARESNVLIVDVAGRIDGVNAGDFESSLRETINEDDKAVVLNLEGLSYISSAGLRSILITAKNLGRRQSKFALCQVPSNIMEIIKIAGFNKIITVHDSRDEATSALGS